VNCCFLLIFILITIPRSSAAVGCAIATFDYLHHTSHDLVLEKGAFWLGCRRVFTVFCFLAFIGENGHENSESGSFQYLFQ